MLFFFEYPDVGNHQQSLLNAEVCLLGFYLF